MPSASDEPRSLFDLTPPPPDGSPERGAGRESGRSEPAPGEPVARDELPGDGGPGPAERSGGPRVVRVLTDEPAIAKTFDYLVPEAFGGQVRVGTRVRIALGPRRVGGWIVATDVQPPAGRELRPLAKLSGHGPPPELIDLAHWAAWRWAGRPATFLRTASPDRVVTALPAPPRRARPRNGTEALAGEALAAGRAVLRLPPAADLLPVVEAAVARGNALVVCPNVRLADGVARRLRRDGVPVALHPRDWAVGAAGATVVGTRAAAWAPVGGLAAVVVLDEHDEAHAQEQAPTWHARDVVAERARRTGVPCVLVSPCPSLEALRWGRLLVPSRRDEREGWPAVDVVDRRDDDPRTGLFSPALVDRLRAGDRVLCVLNRTGRARLLACTACGDLAHCERCEAAVTQPGEDELACPRCGQTRPVVCTSCGSTRFKLLRQGVTRVREELEALVGEQVGEVTGSGHRPASPEELARRVVVGTEAILHQADRADVVAFLDLDQELLAPRYRAAEQALALLTRAARLLGGKPGGGRLVLQTRLPHHEVVQAALHGDPERVSAAEAERRALLRFPPAAALAEVSGAAAEPYVAALREAGGQPGTGVEILGPADGRWLVRAPDHRILCDALAATPRPPGRLRLAVDPLRL